METVIRPGIALTAAAAVALGSAMSHTPPGLVEGPAIPTSATLSAQNVMLTGFIADIYNQIQPVVASAVDSAAALVGAIPIVGPPAADQIDILYSYGQQAVGGTVYWVDDLVTPLANGQFWPLSGQPGNYLAGAFNSTVNWGQGLVNTAIGFVQAEIDWLTSWSPSLPNVVNDVVSAVINTIQNVINWITGWIPGPLAAVPASAATRVAPARSAVTARSVARPAASIATTTDIGGAADGQPGSSAPTVRTNHRKSRAAGGAAAAVKQARKAAARSAN